MQQCCPVPHACCSAMTCAHQQRAAAAAAGVFSLNLKAGSAFGGPLLESSFCCDEHITSPVLTAHSLGRLSRSFFQRLAFADSRYQPSELTAQARRGGALVGLRCPTSERIRRQCCPVHYGFLIRCCLQAAAAIYPQRELRPLLVQPERTCMHAAVPELSCVQA
jgi:hypothetical protein